MWKVLSVFLGIAVAGLLLTAVFVAESANSAKQDAKSALAAVENTETQSADGVATDGNADGAGTGAEPGHVHNGGASADPAAALQSYSGAAPENAEELAASHEPFPAELPPVAKGDEVDIDITLKDVTIEIAPGVKYSAWSFASGAPGPVIHVREGQRINITLTNGGTIPHSIDFHAARIAPNVAFRDVAVGESFTYSFVATDPGVFMYHCGTKPVLAHIANGMYGAIVVDPAKPLPKADREYVLVSSEWYLNGPGLDEPASYNADKAHAMNPDWVTWNGYAAQYVTHPLPADPGEVVRFYVVAAGPSLDTDFHVVGTILDRAYVNGDVTQYQKGVQTVSVPAGGGAIFDVKIDEPGFYPFLSHSFASVDLGQVGLLKVGDPEGTASH
jgi:nitrite reductase (NO-forming)